MQLSSAADIRGLWARLIRSVELLSEGRKVTRVALEVGYDSPSAFIAMFRRELGSTPRRYLRGGTSDRSG